MRPTDKRKKNWGNPIIDKLMKLKYSINDAYNHRQENDGETKSDKDSYIPLYSSVWFRVMIYDSN